MHDLEFDCNEQQEAQCSESFAGQIKCVADHSADILRGHNFPSKVDGGVVLDAMIQTPGALMEPPGIRTQTPPTGRLLDNLVLPTGFESVLPRESAAVSPTFAG